jgi:hypothetical protein
MDCGEKIFGAILLLSVCVFLVVHFRFIFLWLIGRLSGGIHHSCIYSWTTSLARLVSVKLPATMVLDMALFPSVQFRR